MDECIRCAEVPAVDELGYCGHCHWVVLAEVEEGFRQIRDYLSSWRLFSQWDESHGSAPAA
jgi:hypothetical protein